MKIQACNFSSRAVLQYEVCEWQYVIRTHIHQYAELIIALEGETLLTVDGKEQKLSCGECAFIFPFQKHSIYSKSVNKLAFYLFSPTLLTDFTSSNEGKVTERAVFTPSDTTMRIFYDKILGNDDIPLYTLKGFLYFMVSDLLKDNPLKAGLAGTNVVSKVLSYINKHSSEPITLETVAEALNYSKNYLSHCIKSLYGINFCQALANIRVEKAKRLLMSTDKTITQICFECGFGSERSFFRHFKEKLGGLTPSDVQKNWVIKSSLPKTIYYD